MGELDVKKTTFYKLVKEFERDLKSRIIYIEETGLKRSICLFNKRAV
jgi:hypothetical protein